MPKTNGKPTTNVAKQIAQGLVRNALISRAALIKSMLDPTGRDLNRDCGYPDTISIEEYQQMYDRNGAAVRVVRCLPEESWSVDPEVYETEGPKETEFEKAWSDLLVQRNLIHYLARVDEISGIGQFGVLILGVDDGKELSDPLDGVSDDGEGRSSQETKLLYVRPFGEYHAKVASRITDKHSPRYNQPEFYNVLFQDVDSTSQSAAEAWTAKVHWSRVIHVADNRLSSEVFGTPRMQPVWNNLLDIRKLSGGSAEMFWKGAFPGMSFEVNPELNDLAPDIDKDAIREEFQNYMNGLQRYLAVQGLHANMLSPQVADPRGHIEVQKDLIALALSVPFRILFGSEQAQLASGQDASNWAKRIRRRQEKYLTPMLVRPFVERLVACGVLPEPAEIKVDWPDLESPSDQEKAGVALTRTQTLAAYVGGGADQLFPPETFLTQIMDMDPDEVKSIIQDAEQWAADHPESESEMPEGEPGQPAEKKGGPKPPFPVGNFDPDQPRDEQGQWTDTGGGGGGTGVDVYNPETWPKYDVSKHKMYDLWHVTSIENLDAIRKEGLRRVEESSADLSTPNTKRVFMATTEEVMPLFAQRMLDVGGTPAVLHFRVSAKQLAAADPRVDLDMPEAAVAVNPTKELAKSGFLGVSVPRGKEHLVPKQWKQRTTFLVGNFDPDQPRVPAGEEGGGQWASEGGGAGSPVAWGRNSASRPGPRDRP